MGHVFAEIELSNPRRADLAPVVVTALADTGALMLCIREHIAVQLNLEVKSTREVQVADGRTRHTWTGPSTRIISAARRPLHAERARVEAAWTTS